MKLRSVLSLFVATLWMNLPVQAADDAAVAARSAAFELAGAFSANDGYKLRDGYFSTTLKTGESRFFTVNLYSGNAYWFCVATSPSVKKIGVTIHDESGKPLPIQSYCDGFRAAAGLTAAYSGTYYVRLSNLEGGDSSSSTACLLYAYK